MYFATCLARSGFFAPLNTTKEFDWPYASGLSIAGPKAPLNGWVFS